VIRRKEMPLWQELPLLLVVAFCLAVLIRTFLVQAFFIPSGSMENTLLVGDRVLVNKVVYDMRDPVRGEIVVFRGTDNWAPEVTEPVSQAFGAKLGRTIGDLVGISRPGERDFIKRVIGVGGDHVVCCDKQGRVTVNGVPLSEKAYIMRGASPSDRPFDVTVPKGRLWVMGDNRSNSEDSRYHQDLPGGGTVPEKDVVGKVWAIVWPFDRAHRLSEPSTFENPRLQATHR
jgi:signal peptidase I